MVTATRGEAAPGDGAVVTETEADAQLEAAEQGPLSPKEQVEAPSDRKRPLEHHHPEGGDAHGGEEHKKEEQTQNSPKEDSHALNGAACAAADTPGDNAGQRHDRIAHDGKGTPFGRLAAISSPFAHLASTGSPFGGVSKPSAFGSSFSNDLGTFASPNKKPRTAQDAAAGDEFRELLEEKDTEEEEDGAHDQYVQVAKPLQEQDRVTGEEDEETVLAARTKLYVLHSDGWRERGVGQLRLNVRRPDAASSATPAARLVMRTDAVLRLVLNAAIYDGMTVSYDANKSGHGVQSDKFVRLVLLEDGKPATIALKFPSSQQAGEFAVAIRDQITGTARKEVVESAV